MSEEYEGKWEQIAQGATVPTGPGHDFNEAFRDNRTPIEKIADAFLTIAAYCEWRRSRAI